MRKGIVHQFISSSVKLCIIGLALLLNVSCQKESIVDSKKQETFTNYLIMNNRGVLAFPNRAAFRQTLKTLETQSDAEQDKWEARYNFTSARKIFNQIVVAEADLEQNFIAQHTPEELDRLKNSKQVYSPLYQKYLASGFITENFNTDGSKHFYYSFYNPSYAKVINEDGLVQIGDTLMQFTANSLKLLTSCGKGVGCGKIIDFEVLKSATHTDKSNNIEVYGVPNLSDSKNLTATQSTVYRYNKFFEKENTVGRDRIRTFIEYRCTEPILGNWNVEFIVNIQNFRRNVWGNWNLAWASLSVKGDWWYNYKVNMNEPYQWFYGQYPPANFPSASHLILTGNNNQEPLGYWAYNVPVTGLCVTDPTKLTYLWFEATRSGGPSGITVFIYEPSIVY